MKSYMNYLNESLTHDSLIARISKLTFKSLSSMLKSSVFGKWVYIHMKKGQIIFGNNFFFLEKIVFGNNLFLYIYSLAISIHFLSCQQ